MRNDPVSKRSEGTSDALDSFADALQESIMEEVRGTYSEVVIDHWMNPRNFGKIDDPDGYGRVTGPCGDTMEVFLRVGDEKILQTAFLTDGCGTTTACGSIVTEMAQGRSLEEARRITRESILQTCGNLPEPDRHCALLAANTLHKALENCEELKRNPWKRHYRNI